MNYFLQGGAARRSQKPAAFTGGRDFLELRANNGVKLPGRAPTAPHSAAFGSPGSHPGRTAVLRSGPAFSFLFFFGWTIMIRVRRRAGVEL